MNPVLLAILKRAGIVAGFFAVGFVSGAYLRGLHAESKISKLTESIAVEARAQAARNLEIQRDYERRLSEAIDTRDKALADADDFRREFVDLVERVRREADTMSNLSVPRTAPSAKNAIADRNGRLAEIQKRGNRLREESLRLLKDAESIASRSASRADALAKIVGAGKGEGTQSNVGR